MTRTSTAAEYRPCGCTGPVLGTKNSACSCGCCGCDVCAAGPTAKKTGTAEATQRPGVVADAGTAARPNFFAGQMVTHEDLTASVAYHRQQELLSNRMMGGWGVYCGYELSIDANKCCLTVGPGTAYDSCGRALVSCGTVLKEPAHTDVQGINPKNPSNQDEPRTLWLAVAYDDCWELPKPLYGTPCGQTSDPGCDYTRIQERVRFVWLDEEPPHAYWVSGCLPDPCEDEPEKPDPVCAAPELHPYEPDLDRCTPPVGLRGGSGLLQYRQALLTHWNLPRNLALAKGGLDCTAQLAAIFDVIGGQACPPCPGEPMVVIAKVTFGPRSAPSIAVEPLRKRVLSNSDLTYLLLYWMSRVMCGEDQVDPVAEPAPSATVECDEREESMMQRVDRTSRMFADGYKFGARETARFQDAVAVRVLREGKSALEKDRLERVATDLGLKLERADDADAIFNTSEARDLIQLSAERVLKEHGEDPNDKDLAALRRELTEAALKHRRFDVGALPAEAWEELSKWVGNKMSGQKDRKIVKFIKGRAK